MITLFVILLIPAELLLTLNNFSELYCFVVLNPRPLGITIREAYSEEIPEADGTKTLRVSKSLAPILNPSNTFSGGMSGLV